MHRLRVDSQVARELNREAVFNLLRARRVISRIELVRGSGLSKATISGIVDEFISEGYVRTLGPGESKLGRRPVLLEFVPEARYAIGVGLSTNTCRAVLVNLAAEPVRSLTAPVVGRGPDEAIEAAVGLISELKSGLPESALLGIGVGTPGLVDSKRGVIQMAPDVGWYEVPVGEHLAGHFGTPVSVVNRAKAAACGEARCGAGRDVDDLVYMSVSTGIAAGIVIGGRLYRGVSMSEGELGHVTVQADGPLCGCGNRGCLQTLAASDAVLSRVREQLRKGSSPLLEALTNDRPDLLTLELVGQAIAANDPLVLPVLAEMSSYLGMAAANLVNILNPRMLILGGTVIETMPGLVPAIQSEIRHRAVSVSAAAVEVVPSQLGRDAVPIGAAAFLLSQISVVGSYSLLPFAYAVPSVILPPTRPVADHSRNGSGR